MAPNAMAVAVADPINVYVADSGNNQIEEVTPSGDQTTIGSGFNDPQGVAVDSSGTVYVADSGNNRVVKVPAVQGGTSASATTTAPSASLATAAAAPATATGAVNCAAIKSADDALSANGGVFSSFKAEAAAIGIAGSVTATQIGKANPATASAYKKQLGAAIAAAGSTSALNDVLMDTLPSVGSSAGMNETRSVAPWESRTASRTATGVKGHYQRPVQSDLHPYRDLNVSYRRRWRGTQLRGLRVGRVVARSAAEGGAALVPHQPVGIDWL